jgi:transaldolase/glucose-6-phosphate isomerase
MNPLRQLETCGQSLWLDYLKRSLIEKGELRVLVERDGEWGSMSMATNMLAGHFLCAP